MDAQVAEAHTIAYPLGELLTEGKTKQIYSVKNKPDLVLVISKDDITAGDGKKHDLLASKAALSTETTCNVFTYLASQGIQSAFVERDNVNSFVAQRCTMLPYEVVVRREAYGSYLKRHPHLHKGHRFPNLLVEFFLKTSGKRWGSHELLCDDPLMKYLPETGNILLFEQGAPFKGVPFLELQGGEVFTHPGEQLFFERMSQIASDAFQVLEEVWKKFDVTLVDYKVEFGVTSSGTLLLADVIDNDSWRVLKDGAHLDKQLYREDHGLDEVASRYAHVAALTANF